MPSTLRGLDHLWRHGVVRGGSCALLLSSLVLLTSPVSAQRPSTAPFADAGTMTFVTDGSAADLDPASNELGASALVTHNIDNNLVDFDGRRIDRFVPSLATSWSANANKSVWTFHLRHGVRFHTGRCCLTADDVRYSLGRTVAAGLAGSYLFSRFMTKPFQQITIRDPYTVVFHFATPQPLFLNALASPYTGPILDAQALRAHETKHDWGHAWATDHDLGTGPYTIGSWSRSQQIVLRRFAGYWGGWSGRHFSTIMIRTIPESSTRRELVERGQADLTNNLTPQDYDALRQNPQIRLSIDYGTEVDELAMTEWGPLASPYARQAISYAFDYTAYINGVMRHYARRAYGPIPSTLLGYDPHTFHYQTNLAKSKALFQRAGVKPGTVLKLVFTPLSPGDIRGAGLILQAQLAQIGITLKVQQLDSAAFNSIYFGSEPASRRPNFLNIAWYPDYNDPYDMCAPTLASTSTPPAGSNPGFYHNAQVDALLADMKTARTARLVQDAHKLQDVTGRVDPPALWLDEPAQVAVMRRNLQGYVFNPLLIGIYTFYFMHR